MSTGPVPPPSGPSLPTQHPATTTATTAVTTAESAIVHHHPVRKQNYTLAQIDQYNIFRDSSLRYLGYANEVGESFRYQFPKLVVPSYVLAFGYCLADAMTTGKKVYDATINNDINNVNDTTDRVVLLAITDTLLWQSLASVMIPGMTINVIVKTARLAIQKLSLTKHPLLLLPVPVATWTPTLIGLGSIPLIIHPIDHGVDWFMEHTFRKIIQQQGNLEYPIETSTSTTATTATNPFHTNTSLLSNALGSASAGIIARLSTHPLDTAKARLQSLKGSTLYRGPGDVLLQTYRSEGFRGLYRGFSTVIVGGTPGTVVYLCSYDIFKDVISSATASLSSDTTPPTNNNNNNTKEDSFWVHFSSGLLAETVACLVYVPVDVIKERLQVQHKTDTFQYKGGLDALIQISKTEGLSGIYKGYGATLASFGPFSALYFMFYEKFKVWSMQQHLGQTTVHDDDVAGGGGGGGGTTLPFPWIVLSSASAGALASFLTSPLDMAKLRLQVERATANSSTSTSTSTSSTRQLTQSSNRRGMVDVLQSAYQSGGVRGLFRGAGARVLHFVPATTITMTMYETCRNFFQKVLE